MERLINRIMNIGVVVLSLSGVIACSEMEALRPLQEGMVTFTGTPDTCGALETKYLAKQTNITLQAQAEKPVVLQRSAIPLLSSYGVNTACAQNLIAGPLNEVASAKLKIVDLKNNKIDFMLNITLPEMTKTYHFDSKNTLSTKLEVVSVAVGAINPPTVDPATAEIGTEITAQLEYKHHRLHLSLIKSSEVLNTWDALIVVEDKNLSLEDENNFYELGTFTINLDSSNI